MGRARIPPRDIPQNRDPVGWRCVTFQVPDDDEWERIAWSTLYDQLALVWMNWRRTGDNTGSRICRRWRAALATWQHCKPEQTFSIGASEGVELMIRQSPDNPCLLQSSIDGTNWCTFADLSLCLSSSLQNQIQPSPVSNPPEPGSCAEFDVTLLANSKYILPVGVGGGDTVTITALSGGWNDGNIFNWRCPDGKEYGLNACTGSGATSGGDPCNALFHMGLIAKDSAGNCYNAYSGAFTISSGLPNGSQLVFQANDSDLSNNAGSASFHVQICKNAHPHQLYYGLWTSDWAYNPIPSNILWIPINTNQHYTISSPIPADNSGHSNPRAYVYITFADSFDPTTGFANNTGNVCFKVTELNQSGSTVDPSGNMAYWHLCTACTPSGSDVGSPTYPPTSDQFLWFEGRSQGTQFVLNFNVELCS